MRKTQLILAALATWGNLAFAAPGFDINDASVLFPNDGGHKPVPYIDLSTKTLIDSTVVTQVLHQARTFEIFAPQTAKVDAPSDWSVRGFRVDPCAPEEHGKSLESCLFELRLIAQPTARFSPADSALHLIYKIGEGKPSADSVLLKDLLALKTAAESLSGLSTTGEALGIHPVLLAAAKTKREDIPLLFKNFLLKHAHKSHLSKITMMGLRKGAPTDWIFFGGDIEDNRWVLKTIPNRQTNATFVELSLAENSSPFKGAPIDANLSMDQFFNQVEEFSPADLEVFATRAFTLENPALSDRNTSDCLSCHTATTARMTQQFDLPKVIPGVTAISPKGITAFPALGTIQNNPLHWNLRAFGYFGLQATVNMRTLHEAADAAAELNRILGLENPAKDCSAQADEVLQCLIDGTLEPGTVDSTASCLSKCSR